MIKKKTSRAIYVISLLLISFSVHSYEVITPGETVEFTAGDSCSGTPFSDTLLKGTGSGCDINTGHVEVLANLNVGAINSEAVAYSTMVMDFFVPNSSPGSGNVLDTSISAKVDWNGILWGAGVLGTSASIKIEMFLVDEDTGATLGSVVVVHEQHDAAGLKGIDLGGSVISGSRDVSFNGKITTGHSHSVRIRATCQAESGVIGAVIGCAYEKSALTGNENRFVNWDSLFVTIENDTQAQLLELEQKLDEVLRLLHTPQGQRSSDMAACDGEPCDFPNGRKK